MATKEQAQAKVSELQQQLEGDGEGYLFLIPGWEPANFVTGIGWMTSQLWEGFSVAYKIDQEQKIVAFKYWELGEPESEWGSL